MTDSASPPPTWEACKENVLPIKRGRSAKGLSDTLAVPQKTIDVNASEQSYEDRLTAALNGPAEVLLDVYIAYFKWIRDTFPSNSAKALHLLERCTCALKDHTTLKNDLRFVKMWIEYADMVRTPGEIFSFMQSNKIGETVALFWVAWAFVAEKAENFKLTDQIFQKGMKKQAEPKDMLTKRYQQFQRRLARHYLNLADGNATTVAASDIGTGHGGSVDGGPPRQVLGGLSQGQADGTDRLPRGATGPNGINNNNHHHHQSTTTSQSRTVRGLGNSSSSTIGGSSGVIPTRGNNNGAATFQIFTESGPASQGGTGLSQDALSSHSSLAENPHWNNLAPDQQRRKENDGPVTVWNDRPLINNPPAVSIAALPSGTSTSRPLMSMVPIFVDEAFQQPSTTSEPPPSNNPTGTTRSLGLSIRRQLDGEDGGRGGGADLGRIAANPLERHKQSTVGPPLQQPPPSSTAVTSVPISAPISTSISASASAPVSTSASAPTDVSVSTSQPLSSIAIFEDIPPPAITTKKTTITTSSSTAPPPSHLPVATKRLTQQGNAGTSTGGGPIVGKTISSSSSSSSIQPAAATAPATTTSIGFSIFEENCPPPSSLSIAGGGMGVVGNSREGGGQGLGGGNRSQGVKPLAMSSSSQPPPPSSMPLQQSSSHQQQQQPFSQQATPQLTEFSPVLRTSRPRHMTSSSSSSLPQDQEDEVEAMLLAMGLPSSDDPDEPTVTINTRMAQQDINSMFCSPEPVANPSYNHKSQHKISSLPSQSQNLSSHHTSSSAAVYPPPHPLLDNMILSHHVSNHNEVSLSAIRDSCISGSDCGSISHHGDISALMGCLGTPQFTVTTRFPQAQNTASSTRTKGFLHGLPSHNVTTTQHDRLSDVMGMTQTQTQLNGSNGNSLYLSSSVSSNSMDA